MAKRKLPRHLKYLAIFACASWGLALGIIASGRPGIAFAEGEVADPVEATIKIPDLVGWEIVPPAEPPATTSVLAVDAKHMNASFDARVSFLATREDVGTDVKAYATTRFKGIEKIDGTTGLSVHENDGLVWVTWRCIDKTNGNEKSQNAWFFRRVVDAQGRVWLLSARASWKQFASLGEEAKTTAAGTSISGSPVSDETGDGNNSNGDNFAPVKKDNYYEVKALLNPPKDGEDKAKSQVCRPGVRLRSWNPCAAFGKGWCMWREEP